MALAGFGLGFAVWRALARFGMFAFFAAVAAAVVWWLWLSGPVAQALAGLVHDWRRWRTPAALLMGIAVTTFVIYPLFYTPLIHAHPAMAAVLTTRNVLLVVLLCWSVQRVARLQQVPARPAELATT